MTTTPITDGHEELSRATMNRADLAYELARKFGLENRELREKLAGAAKPKKEYSEEERRKIYQMAEEQVLYYPPSVESDAEIVEYDDGSFGVAAGQQEPHPVARVNLPGHFRNLQQPTYCRRALNVRPKFALYLRFLCIDSATPR